MNQEEIRKQFERLVIELNSGVLLERNANDSYKSSLTQYMWWSYQAALSIKQEPVAYRLIASANGEVVRDSLEFTRMSEIDEKVVRKSYDLQIIPLYDNQQEHIESNQEYTEDQAQLIVDKVNELLEPSNLDEAFYIDLVNAFVSVLNQPKTIEPSQVSMPNEIVFGSGKIGVHTEIMSERKAIWLSTLGSGIVYAPTNHPDATSLAPEHVLSVMVFNSKESCKVLIDALTDLYSTEPAQDNEGWIDWDGGDKNNGSRPLTQYVFCEVEFIDGSKEEGMACDFSWKNYGHESDIIKYRIAKESQ